MLEIFASLLVKATAAPPRTPPPPHPTAVCKTNCILKPKPDTFIPPNYGAPDSSYGSGTR